MNSEPWLLGYYMQLSKLFPNDPLQVLDIEVIVMLAFDLDVRASHIGLMESKHPIVLHKA